MAWDEAVTVLSGQEMPYVIYGEVKAHFSPVGIANLTPCVVEINGWGRLMVAFSHATVAVGPFRNGKKPTQRLAHLSGVVVSSTCWSCGAGAVMRKIRPQVRSFLPLW
ncbi:hypothetical protein AZSI13_06630 [Azospira sp. I13]|uniref:hypothetical protein n=1 Tax=Azospira sp. I13 TaxID=1765050 RepID=UPI000D42946A|nr:hypothetical protein [Azospira sp. I13]GBG01336.1 hypothetical protein AZSI13_06630 [Azospira sp. I13]